MTLADITVKRFMRAMFHKEITDIPNWNELYLEFIDLSGIGMTRELELLREVTNLEIRLSKIDSFLTFQRGWYAATGEPCLKLINNIKGHRLTWNPSEPGMFIVQLNRIEAKEKRNRVELANKQNDLEKLKKGETTVDEENSRRLFKDRINSLNRAGYQINQNETDMESFCLMIKRHNEEIEQLAQQNKAA